MFGKTVKKMRNVKKDVFNHTTEEFESDCDGKELAEGRRHIKIKSAYSKAPHDFDCLVPTQDLIGHKGTIWTMKFSLCGKLLATGGADKTIRIWVLKSDYEYFRDMIEKYDINNASQHNSSNDEAEGSPLYGSTTSSDPGEAFPQTAKDLQNRLSKSVNSIPVAPPTTTPTSSESIHASFHHEPLTIFRGPFESILDLTWSKNLFLLSSSSDKNVRIWHISRSECLLVFKHTECVSGIEFLPTDDRYFISGCMDGKIRLWSIPEKKVMVWNEVAGCQLVTALGYCLKYVVVGTFQGMCLFYNTESLKYFTQINVRSTRGRNSIGHKITALVTSPCERYLLVTSNDSRIRLYDVRDLSLVCKYKGNFNIQSQIKASFSSDGKYITCGSEDMCSYIWKTDHSLPGQRRDRNPYWESIKAHEDVVTVSIFAPVPDLIIKSQFKSNDTKNANINSRGEVLISADFLGNIRVFINKFKPE